LRTINPHSLPHPAPEPEYLSVKLVWEGLCPCREFLAQVAIKDFLQRFTVTDSLITCRLIDQRDDSDRREPFE
jgi:hypothetical protein